ncbi:MAG: chemotaxis protein CheD [Verrucomicrobiota bacterium]
MSSATAQQKDLVVGVADGKFTNQKDGTITTYALGSCLGITLYDRARLLGGLIHIMLPTPKEGASTAKVFMYLEKGLPIALQKFQSAGSRVSQLECKVFGGARVMQADNYFSIGDKNIEKCRQMSQQTGLKVSVWEVGGQLNRTIKFQMSDGKVKVRTPGKPEFYM